MCIRDSIGADQIEQFERPHAKTGSFLHQQIDLAGAGDALGQYTQPVSYTHLDVYKRQAY